LEPQEYDEIIRHLVRIAAHQDTINEDLRESIRQQVVISQRLEITQARVETTLARIETLLARMIRHEDNGRDA
jgi:hypothetical protein